MTGRAAVEYGPRPVETPPPPDYMGAAGAALWCAILEEFAIADAHDLQRLAIACSCADRRAEARVQVAEDGVTYLDRFGQPKPHPAVAEERQQAALMIRALRELGLDTKEVEALRPPRPRGYSPPGG